MAELNIAIAGLGTVGVGVLKILRGSAELISARAGKKINVVAVSARDKNKDRSVDLGGIDFFENAVDLADIKNLDLVVELIGGDAGPAKDLVFAALKNGKSVVTANKALVSKHKSELAKLSAENNAQVFYEAAVAGGIPIIKTVREALAGNQINSIYGILNGTCNYILTSMLDRQIGFDEILKEAQELGYAEADPTFDIDGIDTQHKICILASLAFGKNIELSQIPCAGIRGISLADINYACELGYKIKLLGFASANAVSVQPCLVENAHPLANANGADNAIFIDSDALGESYYQGAGAGQLPTASSVMADIIDYARGFEQSAFGDLAQSNLSADADEESEYYVRFSVVDEAGVLAQVTDAFEAENISVKTMLQKARDDGTADIIIITHEAGHKNMQNCLANLAQKDNVRGYSNEMRILS